MDQPRETETGVAGLLADRGKARHDLMAEFGVTENTVRRWEKGTGMTVDRLHDLADYFGVTTDEVLGREKLAA